MLCPPFFCVCFSMFYLRTPFLSHALAISHASFTSYPCSSFLLRNFSLSFPSSLPPFIFLPLCSSSCFSSSRPSRLFMCFLPSLFSIYSPLCLLISSTICYPFPLLYHLSFHCWCSLLISSLPPLPTTSLLPLHVFPSRPSTHFHSL